MKVRRIIDLPQSLAVDPPSSTGLVLDTSYSPVVFPKIALIGANSPFPTQDQIDDLAVAAGVPSSAITISNPIQPWGGKGCGR